MPLFTNISDALRILPRVFGLDISDSGLKFVYLQKLQNEYRVQTFGEYGFEKGVVENGKVLSPPKLAEELKQALGEQQRRGGLPAYAVVGFPEEEVFIRVMQTPQMTAEELAQAIRWEIEGNIPLSIENVYYAHQKVESRAGLDHMDVLVAAAPKEAVDGYMEACLLAGVEPLVVEPASAALARALIPSGKNPGNVVLLDMGATHTRIAIYAEGAFRLTSSIPVSLEDCIKNIMREFSYDRNEAERALYSSGLNKGTGGGKLFEAIIPTLTDLKEQVEKYMNFEKTHREHEHSDSTVSSSVIVAGGGALIPGIAEYFSGVLGATVRLADPWVNLPSLHKGEIPHIPYRDALRFSSSIGLALRGALPPKSLDENNFFTL